MEVCKLKTFKWFDLTRKVLETKEFNIVYFEELNLVNIFDHFNYKPWSFVSEKDVKIRSSFLKEKNIEQILKVIKS